MAAEIETWKEKVTQKRGMTSLIKKELFYLSDLYTEMTRNKLDLYELDLDNDEDYVAMAGQIKPSEATSFEDLKFKRQRLLEYGTNLKDKIERVIDNRSRLITSEIGHMKCRVKQNSRSKIQERKFKRGQMSYVGEIRTVLRDYKDLLEERESLMKAEFYLGMGTV